MADVDLYGGSANTIRGAYKNYLGRDAGDDEVSGWLSGGFGGGGVDDWVRQIENSDEARRRTPSTPAAPAPPTIGTPGPGESHGYDVPAPANDANARALAGLEATYQQFLGRPAAPGDAEKWLSGQFGYGSGVGDYDKLVNAIMSSAEARAYRPPTTGSTPTHSIEYWQQQGVPTIDMFDPLTGQVREGWIRTSTGYERKPGTTTPGLTLPNGKADPGAPKTTTAADVQPWFLQLVQGLPPSPQSLKALEPLLNKYGIKLGPLNARGFTDGIILPNGVFYDVIMGATENGGQGWGFIVPSGVSTGGNGLPGVNLPGNQYSDSYTKMLEELIKSRLGQLTQPVNDPYRQQLAEALAKRAANLGAAEPVYKQLLDFLQQRFTDLKGPGYTGAEGEVIRTGALDPIESDRAAAKKRVIDRLAARGLSPEDGIYQAALLEVDKVFDGMRGSAQTALTTNDLNRREDRAQRAQGIGAQLVDIPQMREREQLDVFQALEMLSASVRGEDEARSREAISYGGALSDLGPQRLQLAMQAAGMGGNPMSLLSGLTSIAGLNQNAALLNSQRSSSLWSGLGSIAAVLARSGGG
jgi:hypothetical protein